MLCFLAACVSGTSGAAGPASNLAGSPEEILNQILEETNKAMPEDKPVPKSFTSAVTAETSQNQIGLSGNDFEKYVTSASVATAMITTFPHEIGVIETKDAASAAEVKKLIASEGGYDSNKWICVTPEISCVVESGNYLLLAVSRADIVAAVVAAFTGVAGSVGEPDEFFTSDRASESGGGMGLSVGGGAAPL